MNIGAKYLGEGRCEFTVWAPRVQKAMVKIVAPSKHILPMERDEWGYWRSVGEGAFPGTLYLYLLDDSKERPDPASSFQPQGVHGPSQVVDHSSFVWADGHWCGVPMEKMVIYELHVGTFTPEGTFAAIIGRLKDLQRLGVTAIELMPVAQFPGERNWGYDGVHPFAVQNSYGGPEELKRLVDACHRQGLGVILDVVYNHLGPEGNYLGDFGPYFTGKYHSEWGEAVNFDNAGSDEVRNYFIENALHWFRCYHLDALRLDAIHAIYDFSAKPFLQELAERVQEFAAHEGRPYHLIAESNLNDVRVIRPFELGGYGLEAQWNDDFHHAVHTLLTGENRGYYEDFGTVADLAKAFREGFIFSWRYSPYRKRHHGSSSVDRPGRQFVVCGQNHDQVGNRMQGERLIALTSFEAAKVAAGAVLFSPFAPLLFMGEEYAEEAPFLYFVSFSDANLVKAVRQGRKEEFSTFAWQGEPPDPQSFETFRRSRLNWEKRNEGKHRTMLEFYVELIALRREIPALAHLDKKHLEAATLESDKLVWLRRWKEDSQVLCLLNFNKENICFSWPQKRGRWKKRIDSAEARWLGPGPSLPETIQGESRLIMPPLSCALYELETG
jgi:maltooligosyltrehalose trehalohydrolase